MNWVQAQREKKKSASWAFAGLLLILGFAVWELTVRSQKAEVHERASEPTGERSAMARKEGELPGEVSRDSIMAAKATRADPGEVEWVAVVQVVNEESGEPSVNARVRGAQVVEVKDTYTMPWIGEAVESSTGVDGRAEVKVPRSWGSRVRLSAESEDGALATVGSVTASSGEAVTLLLSPASGIRGTVHGMEQAAIEDARVVAFNPDWPEAPRRREIRVQPDGRFLVSGVSRYVSLFAIAPGRIPSPIWVGRADDGSMAQAVRSGVNLYLGAEAVSVTILVTMQDGGAVPDHASLSYASNGAWLRAESRHNGRFQLQHLDPGHPVTVKVWPIRDLEGGGFVSTVLDVQLDWETLRTLGALKLQPAVRSRFQIVHQEPGRFHEAPLLVSGPHIEGAGNSGSIRVEVDAEGRLDPFRKYSRAPGQYELRTTSGEILWSGNLQAGDADHAVRVNLNGCEVKRVRVVDDAGAVIETVNGGLYLDCWMGTKAHRVSVDRLDPLKGASFVIDPSTLVRYERLDAVVEFPGFVKISAEVNSGEQFVDIRIPRESGWIKFHFQPGRRPSRCFFELVRVEDRAVRYHGNLREGNVEVIVRPVRPGSYEWNTSASDLAGGEVAGTVEVYEGIESTVLVR